jgi:hypothetical protein
LQDAPIDDEIYGRKNGAWEIINIPEVGDILIYDGEFIPDSLGDIGQIGICRSGVFKKQTKADPRGFWLTGSQTTGGSNMPATQNADGFFADMGENMLVPAGSSNGSSRAWGSPWYYNQAKQVVLVWNDSYGTNGTPNPSGQTGYWWMNVVKFPFDQTAINNAMRQDDGSADYYRGTLPQPVPPNAPPMADGSGGNSWSLNTSQVGSYVEPTATRMVFVLQTENIGDKWIPFNMDNAVLPQPSKIITETQTPNLIDITTVIDYLTGKKTAAVNATLSNQPNNAIQEAKPDGLITDMENVYNGLAWVWKYKTAGKGFWSGARR